MNTATDGERKDEIRLLSLLLRKDDNLSIGALKRLVRIYKKYELSNEVVGFIENWTFQDNNESNSVLDFLYEAIVIEKDIDNPSIIHIARARKVLENGVLVARISDALKFEKLQVNALLILKILGSVGNLDQDVFKKISALFCSSSNLMVCRLSAKVTLMHLNQKKIGNELAHSYRDLRLIRNKAVYIYKTYPSYTVFSDLIAKLDSTGFSYSEYMECLVKKDYEKILFYADHSFFNKNFSDLTASYSQVCQLIAQEICKSRNHICAVLQHAEALIINFPLATNEFTKLNTIDILFDLCEHEDKQIGLLSTIILKKIIHKD